MEGLCFLITITSIRTGQRDRAAIVRCAYELQHYLECAKDVYIDGVQMLCPPTVNGKDVWSLELLLKIVFFESVERDESAVVYQTCEGTYKYGDLDLRRKKTRKVWYSERHLLSHRPQQSHRISNMGEPQLYASTM